MYQSRRRFCWMVLALWGSLPPFVVAQELNEDGLGGGPVPNMITKSSGNEWRGDLVQYITDDHWGGYAPPSIPRREPVPVVSFGWTDVRTGQWGDLTKGGVRTTVGLGSYIDPANSNIFIGGGFCHSYLAGDKSRQVNQPGANGFEGEVDQINMYEGYLSVGYELWNGQDFQNTVEIRFPFLSDRFLDSLLGDLWIPTGQVEARLRLGGVDADLTPTAFDPAKPQVLVANPKSDGLIYGGDLVGTLGWTRPWGGFGVEVTGGLSRTDALTGDWTTIGHVGVGGTVTIFPDSLFRSDNVQRVRNWRQQRSSPYPYIGDNRPRRVISRDFGR